MVITQVGSKLNVLLVKVPEVTGFPNAGVFHDLRRSKLWKLGLEHRASIGTRFLEVGH